MGQQRQSGIELLRLLAMFGIVLSHWGGHGSWELTPDNTNLINKVFIQLTQYFGEVGNCIFVMITGFFLASRDSMNTKGLMRVVKDVKFYAFTTWRLVFAVGFVAFSITGGVLSLLPIIYSQYWFVAPFLLVLVLSPCLNKLLLAFTDKQRKWYFALLLAIELVLPLIFAKTVSSNLGAFVLFYSIGAQLRYLPELENKLMRYNKGLTIAGFGLAIASILLLDIVTPVLGFTANLSMHFIGRFSILPIIGALGLFLLFSKMNITSTIINLLAQSAFAVYLISENPNVYPWFWKRVFDNIDYFNTSYMIGVALLQCAIVFVTCITIDMLYKRLQKLIEFRHR